MAARFDLRYRAAVPLNKSIDKAFSGPLTKAIAWTLREFNYVLKTDNDGVEIFVLGDEGTSPVVVSRVPSGRRHSGEPQSASGCLVDLDERCRLG